MIVVSMQCDDDVPDVLMSCVSPFLNLLVPVDKIRICRGTKDGVLLLMV